MDNYLITGRVLHFISEPDSSFEQSFEYIEQGALVIKAGKIEFCGLAADARSLYPTLSAVDRSEQFILPGFIDTHTHYPQTEIIGAYGEQLLAWLETYTFPTEGKFCDKQYGADTAEFFLNQCLKNGTTTAMVFATVHPESVDAFFEKSELLSICVIFAVKC